MPSNRWPRATSSIESAMTSRLTRRRLHALGAHRHAVADRDRVELHRRAAGRADPLLDELRQPPLVEVAGHRLDPGRRDADDRLGEVVVREPDGLEHGPRRGAVRAVGQRVAVALAGVGGAVVRERAVGGHGVLAGASGAEGVVRGARVCPAPSIARTGGQDEGVARHGPRRRRGPAALHPRRDEPAQRREGRARRCRARCRGSRGCRSAAPSAAPGLGAQPQDLQLAGLVRERLAGQDDVAVDLVGDVVGRERRVLVHERDRPVARPAQRVHPGVHDQPRRAPGVEREDADAVEVAGVEAHLVRQALRVQAPALEERGRPEVPPELGQVRELLADRDLEVVPGDRLVVGERLGLVARPGLRARTC